MKVNFLFYACLQVLLQQKCSILVNGESVDNAKTAVQNVPNLNTSIPTSDVQTNSTNLQVPEKLLNGTGSIGSGKKILSRKITSTESQGKSKVDFQNSTKGDAQLTLLESNVIINMKTSKNNETGVVETKTVNVNDVKEKNIIGINSESTKVPPIVETPIAKTDKDYQKKNASIETKTITSAPTNVPSVTNTITSTTVATTTTSTPKPKKPSITFGMGDFPHLPGEPLTGSNKAPDTSGSKLPISTDPVIPPNAQPSLELGNGFNYHTSRDYIVPIMTILFTIPLAIGVVITTYRRFRDCWSTRHYRRMDFLVDGMYND